MAREAMPTIGDVSNIDFPDVERATLSNGIEVVYAPSITVPVTRWRWSSTPGSRRTRPRAWASIP